MLTPECSEHRALGADVAEPMETLMARPSDRPDGSGKTGSDELARVVRERRESLGWTRQQLADASGIPYPTIAQIETAYRGVSPSRLGVIARVLGLDPKELYDVLASAGETGGPAAPTSAAPTQGRSAQRFRPAGSWHDNPGFAAAAPGSPVGRPARAVSPAAASRPARPAPQHADQQFSGVVDNAVELLSGLPADARLEALSRVQRRVLDQIVQERIEGADRPL
jgi:transcriptional regulator with XRE-family HTH domain